MNKIINKVSYLFSLCKSHHNSKKTEFSKKKKKISETFLLGKELNSQFTQISVPGTSFTLDWFPLLYVEKNERMS
jgi:hypothetical protein